MPVAATLGKLTAQRAAGWITREGGLVISSSGLPEHFVPICTLAVVVAACEELFVFWTVFFLFERMLIRKG